MVDLTMWAFADVLTVDQAACLWVGSDPAAREYLRTPDEASRIAAIKQALSGAISTKLLQADSSQNLIATVGDYSKSLVTRSALRAFAETKGQRPPFLFDTLMPGAVEAPPAEPRAKGGRPVEYDWDAFTLEVIRIADADSLPDKQSELISLMLAWCEETWGREPAESSVKKRISLIYNGLGRAKNS